jgi:hypothetical protein
LRWTICRRWWNAAYGCGRRFPNDQQIETANYKMRIALIACLFLVSAAGCNRPPQRSTVTQPSRAADDTVVSVTEMLRQGADAEAWRNYVQSINHYLAAHPNAPPRHPNQDEKELFANHTSLDKGELDELDSLTFTPLDAHYLDLAFLLRDAAGGLEGLEPLDRVKNGFEWVIRQVRLQKGEGITVPPVLVLRRGWGTARERDLVFLALLDQLGIDGCMVALRPEQGQLHDWVPGALIEKDIYLFDTRLGLPLPGPDGKGIATLDQVRKGLDIRQLLKVEDKYPYDVSPESARRAEVRVAFSLSSLAPRMEFLQNFLAASEKINLWVDPVARFKRFQAAEGPVRVWSSATDVDNALRVLRAFLLPEEGGVAQKPYRELIRQRAVPWEHFPQQLRLPGEPGRQLQTVFAAPFVYFSTEVRMPSELLVGWLPGLSEASVDKPGTRRPPQKLLQSPLPRELMLHGRFDEAASLLVTIHEELQRQKDLKVSPKLNEAVQRWSEKTIEAYSDLFRAEEAGKGRGKETAVANAVAEAKERVNQLWGAERAPAIVLLQKSAAQPMLDRVVYLLALCKQEQAERLQVRREQQVGRQNKALSPAEAKASEDAWKSASSWWGSYLDEHASSPAAPTARLLRARALQALGDRDAAVALLENLSEVSNDLEKSAHLYLAKQLKSR